MDDPLRESAAHVARLAREEDVGPGDVTTALLPVEHAMATFALTANQACVIAGRSIASVVLEAYDTTLQLSWSDHVDDGSVIEGHAEQAPDAIATVTGSLHSILAVERTLLNFLQRLCGVATLTRHFVDAVAGTAAVICDTRKTTPGWRLLEKYAVRCGGGTNHRTGLYDGVLIKDNHLHAIPTERIAGAVFDMLNRLPPRDDAPPASHPFVEVEVDTFEQFEALLSVVGIGAILLDNFTIDALRRAVTLRDQLGLSGRVLLEASGGITLGTVRPVAETGVDRISVGALTHSAPAVDLSLERCA